MNMHKSLVTAIGAGLVWLAGVCGASAGEPPPAAGTVAERPPVPPPAAGESEGGSAAPGEPETAPDVARPDPCALGAAIGRLPACPAAGDCAALDLWRRGFGPRGQLLVPAEGPGAGDAPRRIDLSLRDADLVEVLRSFAEMYDLDLVIDPRVSGRVTVELHDVAWTEALGVILRVHGLGIDVAGGIATVAPGVGPLRPAPGPLHGAPANCLAAPGAGADDER
jgi:hypothetical protein